MFKKSTWIEVRTCVHAYQTIAVFHQTELGRIKIYIETDLDLVHVGHDLNHLVSRLYCPSKVLITLS